MILEGVVTTVNADGSVNLAPMGPIVEETMSTLILRPFPTSTTSQNLRRTGQGVFHVTDDVLLIAQAAVGTVDPFPELRPAPEIEGWILQDSCRWYAFRVRDWDVQELRDRVLAEVVAQGRQRDFFGFNRAKHAVLEAAILATRLHLLEPAQIRAELARLAIPVEKTAGPRERQAFAYLKDFMGQKLGQSIHE